MAERSYYVFRCADCHVQVWGRTAADLYRSDLGYCPECGGMVEAIKVPLTGQAWPSSAWSNALR